MSTCMMSVLILSVEVNLIFSLFYRSMETAAFWFSLIGVCLIFVGVLYVYKSQIKGLAIDKEYIVILKKWGKMV